MEVIKPGRPQKGWSKEFTCSGDGNGGGGCGAVLLVSQYDIYETGSSHYDGSNDYFNTFRCDSCGVETDVKLPCQITPLGKRVHNWEPPSPSDSGD